MDYRKCGVLGLVCLILVIIGGINWGLIGVFSYNLVANLVGQWPAIERIVYILVGAASLTLLFMARSCCAQKGKQCQSGAEAPHQNNKDKPF